MKYFLKKCFIIMVLLCSIMCVPAPAIYAEKHYIVDEEPLCMPVYDGGNNRFDSVSASTEEEIDALEQAVVRTGEYVLVSTYAKEITDDAFTALLASCYTENDTENGNKMFWFADYLNPDKTFFDTFCKVYMYKPVLEAYMEACESDTLNDNPFLSMELEYSTVVIDYSDIYSLSRVGADLSDEINDNIPEWYTTGYLLIKSPANVEITLFLTEEQNYYTFYVKKNKPFYVKMKCGAYQVVKVNTQETGNGEETLPYNDLIQITDKNAEQKNSYVLDLFDFTEKYHITDIDLEDKPDRSENQSFDTESTIVWGKDSDEEQEKQAPAYFWLIFSILVLIPVLLVIKVCRRKRSEQKESEDNDYE